MMYKDIIVLLGSAFFIVVAWIAFNIYHNSVVSTTPEDLQKEILPITPTFDQSTINKIKTRAEISPSYNIAVPLTPPVSSNDIQEITPEITPEITIEPQSTDSALIASEGGEITP